MRGCAVEMVGVIWQNADERCWIEFGFALLVRSEEKEQGLVSTAFAHFINSDSDKPVLRCQRRI